MKRFIAYTVAGILLASATICCADSLCRETVAGKDRDGALEEYAKVLASGKSNKDMAAIYNNRGYAEYKKEFCDQAIAYYNRAITLNPKLADAYFNVTKVF